MYAEVDAPHFNLEKLYHIRPCLIKRHLYEFLLFKTSSYLSSTWTQFLNNSHRRFGGDRIKRKKAKCSCVVSADIPCMSRHVIMYVPLSYTCIISKNIRKQKQFSEWKNYSLNHWDVCIVIGYTACILYCFVKAKKYNCTCILYFELKTMVLLFKRTVEVYLNT